MANWFYLTLDTTAPSNPSILLEGGSTYASQVLIVAAIDTTDTPTTGYQMKLWGDIDLAWAKTNGLAGAVASAMDEASAEWITYATSIQLQLSSDEGLKAVYLKIRDSVFNESAQASDTIILDTTLPTIDVSGSDVPVISEKPTKNTATFSFQVNEEFKAFKVKVVNATNATHDTGTQLGTVNGSINMQGSEGNYAANTPINCSINATDLKAASSSDDQKIIKIFVQDMQDRWSV